MVQNEIRAKLSIVLFLLGVGLWNINLAQGLDLKAWHLFITFLITILGIITTVMPMGAVSLLAITVLVLTNTLSLKEALSGFSSPIAWLVLIAFFIARGFIKTNLGKRIAYILITKFGKTNIGLSYSLIFTELLLSPMIPSTSARGGGIIYPIASSLANAFDKNKALNNTSKWIIATSFHTNVICCSLFLTAMSGNLLIQSLAQSVGIQITWAKWALATIIPGILNLLLLPYVTSFLLHPDRQTNSQIIDNAKKALQEKGNLTKDEMIMALTFFLLLFFWIFGSYLKIEATTAAFIGLLILVFAQVINWNEITSEKTGWETFIWFAILLMLSDYLAKFGVDKWLEHNIRHFITDFNHNLAIFFLIIFYFPSLRLKPPTLVGRAGL
jgi:DASS family divalent anion:Na+ symporter